MRIKRTKTGQGGPDDLPPSTREHWAKAVDRSGLVVAWVASESDAGDFDEATARKVLARCASRPNAGDLEVVGLVAGAPPAGLRELAPSGGPRPNEDDLREAVNEIERQREVIARQAGEIASLTELLAGATQPVTAEGPRPEAQPEQQPPKAEAPPPEPPPAPKSEPRKPRR